MQPHRLRLAAGLLTFFVGASLAYELRRPSPLPDCYCTGAKCRLVSISDDPVVPLLRPLETAELILTARWID